MAIVSVIIPAFNPGGFLLPALQSVIAQTMNDWEAIVVDDGSPEDVSWVGKLDQRIQYLRQENQGQAAARNTGIAAARGRYIAFLDQDDIWLACKMQRQVDMLDANPAMVACHTQFELMDAKGGTVLAGYGRRQSYAEMLEGSGICGASTVTVRREALAEVGGFNDDDRPAEDLDLWLRLARTGEIGFIDDVLARYRIHGVNQSLKYRQLFAAIRCIQLRQMKLAPDLRERALIGIENHRSDAAGKAFEQLRTAVRRRSIRDVAVHALFVIRHRPGLLGSAILARFQKSPNLQRVVSER